MPCCTLCSGPAPDGFKRCRPCRDLQTERTATWRQKRKAAHGKHCQRHPSITLVSGGCRRCVAITGQIARKAA